MKKPGIISLVAMALGLLIACTPASEKVNISTERYIDSPTKFVEVDGDQFAYRQYGHSSEIPLILLMHTRGNMDGWDPKLLDALAKQRTVIAFDNRGIGLSTGKTPESFSEMADDAAKFIKKLNYQKVDLLGFSIGGAVAQELLLNHNSLVRKAVLAGTSAAGGEKVNQLSDKSKSVSTKAELTDDDLLYAFFAPTKSSQELGKGYLKRIKLRKVDRDIPVTLDATKAQAVARQAWGAPKNKNEDAVKNITNPVLIANGKDDIRMPTINSYHLFNLLPNAQLVLYPDSGHGFLFQYPDLFAQHVSAFLNTADQNKEHIMPDNHTATPTRYIEVDGDRFAYRRWGNTSSGHPPLFFLQHFRGGMDNWDPTITDGLAASREVILYNYRGSASSSGTPRNRAADMADDAAKVIKALGLPIVDVVGFSIGGFVAQDLTLRHPHLVRKLILLGTGPRGGVPGSDPKVFQIAGRPIPVTDDFLYLFFGKSDAAQQAGRDFWKRRHQRKEQDTPSSPELMQAQMEAIKEIRKPVDVQKPYAYLQAITQPTLVINGADDIMVPTINSWHLTQNIPNAQLIVYPDAGHGAQFQYPERFLKHALQFLDE